MGSGKDQILKCGVEGDELVIRIGIDTLVFAAGLMPGDEPLPTVVNHEQFAHDVVAELNSEEEADEDGDVHADCWEAYKAARYAIGQPVSGREETPAKGV